MKESSIRHRGVKRKDRAVRPVSSTTWKVKNLRIVDIMQECALSDIAEWDHKELLAHEKETLGFYITGHPLLRFAEKLHTVANVDTSSINDKKDRDTVAFGGVVNNIREVTTKKKEVMAYITIEDLRGSVTVICFADLYS